jgi:hypothetical protein
MKLSPKTVTRYADAPLSRRLGTVRLGGIRP